ncbi:DUF3408 domain-containing protein [Alistipes putredinis]|uniref:DUF3408 domain-containing protein n=1 Tax=Alistipes putredinis TaxID=28117 RepID=UPI003A8F8A94
MAKRMKAGPLDESLIIQSFKDADLLADPANAVLQEAGERPAASRRDGEEQTASRMDGEEPVADEAAVPADGTAKGKSRRRKGSYDEVYLKRRELKTRQPVYISQEIHRSVIKLVHLLALAGKEISVGGYIDNVLAEHLRQHKDEIAELYRSGIDDILQTDH